MTTTNYDQLLAVWYRAWRTHFSHAQVRVFMYTVPEAELERLKTDYEGADLKVELGDER